VVLKNGLTVILSERPGLPLVATHFVVRAGSGAESPAQAGLASLSYKMLLEGAGKRDTLALADAFSELGTTVSPSIGADGAQLSMTVLKRNLTPAIALLSDVVLRPKLPPKEFARKKDQQLANLARMMGNPRYLSMQASAESFYGPSHPYGHLSDGKKESVSKLTIKDVRRFLKDHLGPKASALIFTGDLNLEEAKRLAEKAFGAWKSKATPWVAPPVTAPSDRGEIVVIPKAGLGQTVLSVGQSSIAAGDPDEWALRIASLVYGGLFSSRLNMNLREDKGYTYGAYAQLDTRFGGGSLAMGSSVRADVTGPALKEFFAELEGLTTHPITEAEFKDAVEGAIRSLPGWFETVGALAGSADALFLEHQPLDRMNQMLAAYRALTLEEVRAAAAKHFVPSKMQIVLVGDGALIDKQVTPLGLGSLPSVGDTESASDAVPAESAATASKP